MATKYLILASSGAAVSGGATGSPPGSTEISAKGGSSSLAFKEELYDVSSTVIVVSGVSSAWNGSDPRTEWYLHITGGSTVFTRGHSVTLTGVGGSHTGTITSFELDTDSKRYFPSADSAEKYIPATGKTGYILGVRNFGPTGGGCGGITSPGSTGTATGISNASWTITNAEIAINPIIFKDKTIAFESAGISTGGLRSVSYGIGKTADLSNLVEPIENLSIRVAANHSLRNSNNSQYISTVTLYNNDGSTFNASATGGGSGGGTSDELQSELSDLVYQKQLIMNSFFNSNAVIKAKYPSTIDSIHKINTTSGIT